jgi:hypothetical protein
MAARTEEITRFAMLATEAGRRVAALETAHTSDPPFNSPMVLFKAAI